MIFLSKKKLNAYIDKRMDENNKLVNNKQDLSKYVLVSELNIIYNKLIKAIIPEEYKQSSVIYYDQELNRIVYYNNMNVKTVKVEVNEINIDLSDNLGKPKLVNATFVNNNEFLIQIDAFCTTMRNNGMPSIYGISCVTLLYNINFNTLKFISSSSASEKDFYSEKSNIIHFNNENKKEE